jgi:hypothetical protein
MGKGGGENPQLGEERRGKSSNNDISSCAQCGCYTGSLENVDCV